MACSRVVAVLLLGLALTRANLSIKGWRPILPPGVTSYDSRYDPPPQESEGPEEPLTPLTSRGSILSPLESSPFGHQYQNEESDQCTLYKVNFNQQLYFQYIQYKVGIPDIKEFTLCMWTKFNNHSNDHPLFSYSVPNQPRAILSWVSNTARASYYSMAVEGHIFYRLNYPLRLNRWYHSCQSWNGNTGEWQVWVNAERVGRGFHNRLVGHVIPGGGVAITGQEQRQQGGGFLEGSHGGFLGEVTMVQMYAAALAPGKAHKDHKHHHGQHTTPTPTASPTTTVAPPPSFLVGNQLPAALNLNLGNLHLQRPLLPPGATPSPTLNPLALLGSPGGPSLAAQQPHLTLQQHLSQALPLVPRVVPQAGQQYGNVGFGNIPAGLKLTEQNGELIQQSFHGSSSGLNLGFDGINFLGGAGGGQRIFKRQEVADKKVAKRNTDEKEVAKRNTDEKEVADKKVTKRNTDAELNKEVLRTVDAAEDKKQTKRGVFFSQSYPSALGSLSGFGQGLNLLQSSGSILDLDGTQNGIVNAPSGEGGKDDGYPREPAEGEVLQIMNVCSGCDHEPFKPAEMISWRNTPKKLYSGALYLPAKPHCRRF